MMAALWFKRSRMQHIRFGKRKSSGIGRDLKLLISVNYFYVGQNALLIFGIFQMLINILGIGARR